MKEILLIGFYDDRVFSQFVAGVRRQYPDISIKYLREYHAMGTAGGLYHFRDVILRGHPKRFFVIHADVISSFPLNELNEFFDEKKASAVIYGARVPYEVVSNYGAIVINDQKRVIHYVERPESKISNLINAGIYLFDDKIFNILSQTKTEKELKSNTFSYEDEDTESDILRLEDILVKLPETGSFYAYDSKDFFRQVKAAASALPANALYLQKLYKTNRHADGLAHASTNIVPPVYINPSATVDPTAKLGPNVTISAGCKIGKGVRIKDSIILSDVEIKHDAAVLHSIVSISSKIGAWARIEGTPISLDQHDTFTIKDGVKVRSATILGSHVNVSDEVHVQNTVVLPHKDIKSDVENDVIM